MDWSDLTANAAPLEDPTRLLGVLVTFLGALVVNPDATKHFVRGLLGRGARAAVRARGFLARFIPRLRQDATVIVPSMGMAAGTFGFEAHARGFVGFAPEASVDEKLASLDNRTKVLHTEVGELQAALRNTEKQIKRDLSDAVDSLRSEAQGMRRDLDDFRHETVQSDASALPVIVVGVVLAGLAPDADQFQMWAWSLFVLILCGYAIHRSWRLLR